MPVRLTGMISGMDTESLIKGMVDAQRLKNKKTEDKSTLLEWKQDKWKELNTKLYKLYTEDLSKMRLQGSYKTKKVLTSNDNLVSVSGDTSAATGVHTLIVNRLASSQYVTGTSIGSTNVSTTKLSELGISDGTTFTFNGTETLTVDANTTINDFLTKAKSAGLNANYDVNQGRFFISSKSSGVSNGFSITTSSEADLNKLGLESIDADGTRGDSVVTTLTTIVKASDSEIVYNGTILNGESNEFNINGLKLNLKGVNASETINLTISNDTQATYDMVKKFVTSYNDILKEMNSLYYSESTRGYSPLSDDDKDAMTDDQIEKWETKIKDSILRRDTGLGSLLSVMKSAMGSTVAVNSINYSLANYGIQTSTDYTEKGLLHINGNADDAIYSGNENKLMKALQEDPDTVIEVLSGITKNLYNTMNDKMKAIPNVSSALTFYNDKLMDKQQTEYKKRISILEDKLVTLEDKYYKQFAAMETAMAKLQSQSNALAGMLGIAPQ